MASKPMPQRRAKQHDPLWTSAIRINSAPVNRKVLEANRQIMSELIRRAQCGEVKPLVLPPGKMTIEKKGGD